MTVVLAITAGVLFATGTYLLLQKMLSRVIVGFLRSAYPASDPAASLGHHR